MWKAVLTRWARYGIQKGLKRVSWHARDICTLTQRCVLNSLSVEVRGWLHRTSLGWPFPARVPYSGIGQSQPESQAWPWVVPPGLRWCCICSIFYLPGGLWAVAMAETDAAPGGEPARWTGPPAGTRLLLRGPSCCLARPTFTPDPTPGAPCGHEIRQALPQVELMPPLARDFDRDVGAAGQGGYRKNLK
jgi:hypothetical protein